jgi:uncharacterized membrane protein YjgN (DUF898 family)
VISSRRRPDIGLTAMRAAAAAGDNRASKNRGAPADGAKGEIMEIDTQPMWPAEAPHGTTAARERPLAVRFTGSGSEYFRIWIVNLLLSIVTLSLYRPWAKVRRLRYFYANTLVDGHAFDFHGNPWKMLRGYLLVGAMLVCYSVAGRFSAMAALVALLILAVLWPALLRASMQFRLANTSWRGLRFRFNGTLGGAYRGMLPLFVPALAMGAMRFELVDPQHPTMTYIKHIYAIMGLTLLVAPLMWWMFKRYQHDNYGLGQWQTKLGVGPGSAYWLALRILGVALGSIIVVAVIVGIGGAVMGGAAMMSGVGVNKVVTFVLIAVLVLIGYMLVLMVPVPYAMSRAQNLVWGHTSCDEVRFDSQLRFDAMFKLTLKNWLLMLVTLGLYYPFAVVSFYRLRVESITPHLSGNLDQLQAQGAGIGDASGDAAGDLFGIDIGL